MRRGIVLLVAVLSACAETGHDGAIAPAPHDPPRAPDLGLPSVYRGPESLSLAYAFLRASTDTSDPRYTLALEGGRFVGNNEALGAEVQVGTGGAAIRPGGAPPLNVRLHRFGCAGDERELPEPHVQARHAQRIDLVRPEIREWYLNAPAGLEQGFVTDDRGCRELRFISRASDGWRAEVSADGSQVHLRHVRGETHYAIGSVFAFDADERALPARFERAHDGWALRVDASGARFPIVVDPLTYRVEATLSGSATYYGQAVGVYEDTAVISGEHGNVYVFHRTGTTWAVEQVIPAPSTTYTMFGRSVAIWRDTVAIGEMRADTARGVAAGRVHVYVRSGTTWSLEAIVEPTSPGAELRFGCSVGLYEDTLVAGPYGGPDLTVRGSAYVFTRSGTTWTQRARLVPSDSSSSAFGRTVAISGDTIVVGSMMDSSGGSTQAGSLYVFTGSGPTWTQQARLFGSAVATNRWLGYRVDLDGDVLLASAPGSWSAASWLERAYFFERSGGTWAEVARHDAPRAQHYAAAVQGAYAVLMPYAFQRSALGWELFADLTRSSGSYPSGWGVDVYGDTAVVGTGVPPSGGPTAYALRLSEVGLDGEACHFDFECASGFCVDGVCCESECNRRTYYTERCSSCRASVTGEVDGACRPRLDAATILCRRAYSACDVEERCDTSLVDCPPDLVRPAGTSCRPASGPCDAPESCTGSSTGCPPNTYLPAGIECRPPVGECDVAETCTGASASCPTDRFDTTTICRPLAGPCDVAERCLGGSASCPIDRFQGSFVTCRGSAGVCDPPELCTGSGAECPPDTLLGTAYTCRSARGVCDAPEGCNGIDAACPPDVSMPDGSSCSDGRACNGAEVCASGSCRTALPLDCDDRDPCTADACDDAGGCTHAPVAGCCRTAAECDDADPCTDAGCVGYVCVQDPIAGCCHTDADCDDGDGCTRDRCDDANACAAAAIAGCCASDSDCDDGLECTSDRCVGAECVHDVVTACCVTAAECDDGDGCTRDACVDERCVHETVCVDSGAARPDAAATLDGGTGEPVMRGGCGCRAGTSGASSGVLALAALGLLCGRLRRPRSTTRTAQRQRARARRE